MIPDSYKKQNGCYNCKFVFEKREYDSCGEFFCTFNDKEKRPKCGSVYMNEQFSKKIKTKERHKEIEKGSKKWNDWSNKRIVSGHGICSEYQEGNKVLTL